MDKLVCCVALGDKLDSLAVKFSLFFAVDLVVKFVCLYKEGTRLLLGHCN
jgi:hypothetical protein